MITKGYGWFMHALKSNFRTKSKYLLYCCSSCSNSSVKIYY